MKKLSANLLSPVALAVTLASTAAVVPTIASAEWSGNIGIHSKYLLRGIFNENDDTAVQGGFDYASESGFYAGWWASNLGYTYDANGAPGDGEGFENDFYAGYAGSFEEISYDIGLIQYVYMDVDDSNLTELTAGLGFGPFSFGLQYLLNDGWWGNSGDIYWKLGYSTDLPADFAFAADLGYYTYDDDDSAEIGGPGTTTNDSGFRHLNLTLSHPVGATGADMYVQYTFAGEDRTGNDDYEDSVVVGITYGFDI